MEERRGEEQREQSEGGAHIAPLYADEKELQKERPVSGLKMGMSGKLLEASGKS